MGSGFREEIDDRSNLSVGQAGDIKTGELESKFDTVHALGRFEIEFPVDNEVCIVQPLDERDEGADIVIAGREIRKNGIQEGVGCIILHTIICHTSVARRPPVLTGGGSASTPSNTFIIDANPYKGNA